MTNLDTSTKAPSKSVIDPVCGMTVEPGQTKLVALYNGHSYWFCTKTCRTAFETNPRKHLEAKSIKRKGWFRRHLERMANVNEEQFGCSGPKCH
jgi:YHS domain-containing protein